MQASPTSSQKRTTLQGQWSQLASAASDSSSSLSSSVQNSPTATTTTTTTTTAAAAAAASDNPKTGTAVKKSRSKNGTKTPGRTPRIRSFGGCFTCRARKVKCDERHPLCNQCERSGLVCAGYEAKIRFILYGKNGTAMGEQGGHDGGHGRRILFTECQRQQMSEDMKKAVNADEVDSLLNTLERDLSDPSHTPEPPLGAEGPFSVFYARDGPLSHISGVNHGFDSTANLGSSSACAIEQHPSDRTKQQTVTTEEVQGLSTTSPLILATEAMLVDLGQALAHSPKPTTAPPLCPSFQWQDSNLFSLQSLQFPAHLLQIDGTCTSPVQNVNPGFPVDNMFRMTATPSSLSASLFHSLPSLASSIHMHSHFLLDHYKSQMGKLFSPLRARKPPWSILHFPRALTALSELAVFKTLNHAHMSLLFAVLAVSAFNWDNIHRGEEGMTSYWRRVGDNFRLGAKRELELAGEREMIGEKSAKYKDILMAILTMVTISVVSGQQDEARLFILNAELFICLRGINKPKKSRKVKLLHCIYLYLRVIEESTFAYPLEKQPAGNLSVPLKRMLFPSLRTNSLCVGRDVDQQCGTHFEHCLFGDHGSSSADSDPTFFVEIYGIPHKMLSLISWTTFLANEINMLRRRSPEAPMTFNLESSCKDLEDEICGWKYSGMALEGDEEDPIASFANQSIMPHLVRAFHNATLIFFYRRVREVHPFILQPLVEQTIQALEAYEQEQRNFMTANCSVVWPGFIAGAEAMDEALQARYIKRLQEDAQTSGMMNFSTSATVLEQFWSYRREINDATLQWLEFVRTRQISLVLT